MAGAYISWPFCAQKCTYCNFASGVFPRELESDYLAALKAEIDGFEWQWTPDTVYLGGGTPSVPAGELWLDVLDRIPGRPWREATMEAAPGTITLEKASAWRQAGINRVSLGVQSFVQQEIARTGRKHTADTVAHDVAVLREIGIANINVDLIAGLAGQTRESWRESLDWVERLTPPHVSVYMLEIDEDSRLGNEILLGGRRYGASDVPGEELTAEFYETAVDRLRAAGIPRYEISNFAQPGCESAHNLKYWRREPYTGFGADAHSFDGTVRRANAETARDYVDRWRSRQVFSCEVTAAGDDERFFLGLRLDEGMEATAEELAPHTAAIERFVNAGLVERTGTRLRLTRRGVLLSNEVFQEFIAA